MALFLGSIIDLERERNERFEEIYLKFSDELNKVNAFKEKIEREKDFEMQKIRIDSDIKIEDKDNLIAQKEREIQKLKIENIIKENKIRKKERESFITQIVDKWRRKSWKCFIIMLAILLIGIIWIFISFTKNSQVNDDILDKILQNKIIAIVTSTILTIINYFVIRGLYDKYHNHSNINAFKVNINIPDDLIDLPVD